MLDIQVLGRKRSRPPIRECTPSTPQVRQSSDNTAPSTQTNRKEPSYRGTPYSEDGHPSDRRPSRSGSGNVPILRKALSAPSLSPGNISSKTTRELAFEDSPSQRARKRRKICLREASAPPPNAVTSPLFRWKQQPARPCKRNTRGKRSRSRTAVSHSPAIARALQTIIESPGVTQEATIEVKITKETPPGILLAPGDVLWRPSTRPDPETSRQSASAVVKVLHSPLVKRIAAFATGPDVESLYACSPRLLQVRARQARASGPEPLAKLVRTETG